MVDPDVVGAHLRRYGIFRYVTIGITVATIPLNMLTVYLIVWKSPKCLGTYKYVLLNIVFWVCLTDMIVDVFGLFQSRLEIFGVYATGLAKSMGPQAGFACLVLCTICLAEYFVALLLAFIYRLFALSVDFSLFGRQLKKWHYWSGAATLLIVPSLSLTISTLCSYYPQNGFQEYVRSVRYAKSTSAVVVTELAFSMHSAVNAVAIIVFIAPYRKAVQNMLNVPSVNIIHGTDIQILFFTVSAKQYRSYATTGFRGVNANLMGFLKALTTNSVKSYLF
uniref:G protein-coupled receptor n=1 Tax=Steinernema glaseri TaxID=37863 RepID=A0A1I8ABP8_9BILA